MSPSCNFKSSLKILWHFVTEKRNIKSIEIDVTQIYIMYNKQLNTMTQSPSSNVMSAPSDLSRLKLTQILNQFYVLSSCWPESCAHEFSLSVSRLPLRLQNEVSENSHLYRMYQFKAKLGNFINVSLNYDSLKLVANVILIGHSKSYEIPNRYLFVFALS